METGKLDIYKGIAAKAVENIFFDELSASLRTLFEAKGLRGVLIGNPTCPSQPKLAPDILLITQHAVLIIDLKNYEAGGSIELPTKMFFESGQWVYHKDDEEVPVKGGSHSNPFKQVGAQRMKMIDMLAQSIPNFNPRHICTGVLFQNHITVNGQIPNRFSNHFFICDKDNYLKSIYNFINVEDDEVNLTQESMNQILAYFEAEEYQNVLEFATRADVNGLKDTHKISNKTASVAEQVLSPMIKKLEPELKKSLEGATSIDILTGYFYFSGFSRIAEELRDKKIRILVGKAIDPNEIPPLTQKVRTGDPSQINLDEYSVRHMGEKSRSECKELYIQSFIEMFNKSSLTDLFDGTEGKVMRDIFESKLKDGSMEIRMVPANSEHSKFYIIKNSPEKCAQTGQEGIVYMGSSNFTYSGLIGQGETNESFTDISKLREYADSFEKLWNSSEAVDIQTATGNKDFLVEIQKKLFIHSTPEPYKIYVRILHELYSSVENEDEIKLPGDLSEGKFANLKYQIDAIKQGLDCLEKHNGVIIADVVGLGKSIIGAAIASNLDMRTIIIAPPHLKRQWEDYANDFKLSNRFVESSGKIEHIHKRFANDDTPTLYIIDEAHRYRNEITDDYQYLHQLTRSCKDNKVILLTATPYNNKPNDIFALIKLFQTPSRSTLNTVDNLATRFAMIKAEYERLAKKGKQNYRLVEQELKSLSACMRAMIEPVVIRRSRIDLKEIKEYANDLAMQNISFPKVIGPELINVDLGELSNLYCETLGLLVDEENGFKGARYQSANYVVDTTNFEKNIMKYIDSKDLKTAQTNLADFMRRLLVRRFESSKYAFKVTLDKIIASNNMILKWWDKGFVPIRKGGILYDPDSIGDESLDEILDEIEGGEDLDIEKYKKIGIPVPKAYFSDELVYDIQSDIDLLEKIKKQWFPDNKLIGHDPKIDDVTAKIKQLLSDRPERKIVVFSSYADTAMYVYEKMVSNGIRALLYYSGSPSNVKEEIIENFDASCELNCQKDNYDVIIATDALSEGFNLHRAGIIINYDIPYNPTRVIQRIGRINRINKKMFDEIYIYNCFPTETGDEIIHIKGISTLKVLLINNIVGSDTKTLTTDEELQSFFRRQYEEADSANEEASWDNLFRNDYNNIKHNTELINEVLEIPEHTRVIRKNQQDGQEIAVSFAKRGNNYLFATADKYDEMADIRPPEQALKYFRATDLQEKSYGADDELERKFSYLKQEIMKPYEVPEMSKRRQEALKNLEFLRDNYARERDYLSDLYDIIKEYDDFSEGELKFIAQILNDINGTNDEDFQDYYAKVLSNLKAKFSTHYLSTIKTKAEEIAKASEIIMFTEDIRNE